MSVYDPLLYILDEAGRSARWNFPLGVGQKLLDFGGIGTAVSLTYSFMAGIPDYEAPGDHPGFTPFDATMQDAARRALAAWAAVAKVTFTEVADAGDGGQIRFGQEATSTAEGYAEPPRFAYGLNPTTQIVTGYGAVPWMGDIYLGTAPADAAVAPGGFGYAELLQLIGNALGLKDPTDGALVLPATEAGLQTTVMIADTPAAPTVVAVTGSAGAYSWTEASFLPTTPMLYDIAALQYLYGANTATNAGDTTYAWAPNARLFETIWDGGGTDSIDTGNQTLPSSIDLREGHYSSIAMRLTEADRRLEIPDFAVDAPTPTYDGVNNLAIAFGVTIENARGGAGADRITGNAVANLLEGGAGDDTLDGGSADDTLVGGAGDDTYLVDRPGDVVIEAADGGTDTVVTTAGYRLLDNIEKLTLATGAGGIFGVGNGLANTLAGNAGGNILIAWDGDDTVFGDDGNDVLHGGAGDDSLDGGAGSDELLGGDGRDTLDGGAGGDTLHGEAGDDSLVGGPGSDMLFGGSGNDTLDGASGLGDTDYLHGGAGDDSYCVDTPSDVVFELAGEGIDTVFADIGNGAGYCLPGEVENLVLLGATAYGAGNSLANAITGNASGNWLLGGAGDDTLNGKGGDDTLFGEAGADTFVFEPGTGSDTVGDFASGTDHILLVGFGFSSFAEVQAAFGVAGDSSIITLGQGDFVVLLGVTALTAADVILA